MNGSEFHMAILESRIISRAMLSLCWMAGKSAERVVNNSLSRWYQRSALILSTVNWVVTGILKKYPVVQIQGSCQWSAWLVYSTEWVSQIQGKCWGNAMALDLKRAPRLPFTSTWCLKTAMSKTQCLKVTFQVSHATATPAESGYSTPVRLRKGQSSFHVETNSSILI